MLGALRRRREPWWVVRFSGFWNGEFEVLRAESRVMARFWTESADGARRDPRQADTIGWIEGPFKRKPRPLFDPK